MTTEAPSTLTPKVLTDDERFIETKLQQFTISKESLREMAGKYTDLIAQGKDADLKVIYVARQTLKKKRTEITNFGKSLRTSAVAFQKAVIAREDELIAEIEPTEKALETIEDGIIEDKRKAKEEADRKEKQRIQTMVDRLNAVEAGTDITALMGMTDEQFEDHLKEATAEYQIVLDARAAKMRLEAEQKQKEQDEFIKKQNELQREAIRLEKIKKEQAETARKQKEAQDKIDAANRKIEEEKRKAVEARNKMIIELRLKREHILMGYGFTDSFSSMEDLAEMSDSDFERLETVHRNAHAERLAETKRVQEEERLKLEKEEADERLAFGSDADRFRNLAQQLQVHFLDSSVWTMFTSKKGKIVAFSLRQLITQAKDLCDKNSER